MITAITSAETLMDCNGVLRDSTNQFQRKAIPRPIFLGAFHQLSERATKLGLRYFPDFDTYAPEWITVDVLERIQSESSDLTERKELQEVADLLRSGTLNLPECEWQLKWHFLLQRGANLLIFWNSETKRFV